MQLKLILETDELALLGADLQLQIQAQILGVLDDDAQTAVVRKLAQLMAKVVAAKEEEEDDE